MQTLLNLALEEEHVSFLEPCSYEDAIRQLVESISTKIGGRCDEVTRKVLERERVVSTAIGMGIAIPHGRCDFLNDFTLGVGICKKDGIAWNAIDGERVQIICLIAGPESKPKEYLTFLSSITSVLNDDSLRHKIVNEIDKKNIVNIFHSC